MSMPSVYHIKIKGSKRIMQCVSTKVQFAVDIEVGHPQFKNLKTTMDALSVAGDAEGFRNAAAEYLRLADELVQGSVEKVHARTNKLLGYLGSTAGVLILLTVMIVTSYPPLLLVSIPGVTVCCIYAYRLSKRLDDAEEFAQHLVKTYYQRLDDTCVSAGFRPKGDNDLC